MQQNIQPNTQPNMQQNFQPNLQQNIQPNMQQNNKPNIQQNIQPNIQPKVQNVPTVPSVPSVPKVPSVPTVPKIPQVVPMKVTNIPNEDRKPTSQSEVSAPSRGKLNYILLNILANLMSEICNDNPMARLKKVKKEDIKGIIIYNYILDASIHLPKEKDKDRSKSQITNTSMESELQRAIRLRQEKLHQNDLKKSETTAWDSD